MRMRISGADTGAPPDGRPSRTYAGEPPPAALSLRPPERGQVLGVRWMLSRARSKNESALGDRGRRSSAAGQSPVIHTDGRRPPVLLFREITCALEPRQPRC